MNPPWTEFPEISMVSVGWRMGPGETYMQSWVAWYRAVLPRERHAYQIAWPEPEAWAGFYRHIDTGVLPTLIAEHRARLDKPRRLPLPDERTISDPYQVQWLMRNHMRQIDPFQVAARHPSPYIGEREGEHLMGYYAEPDGSWWRVSSRNLGGLQMLRIDAELLRDWSEQPL